MTISVTKQNSTFDTVSNGSVFMRASGDTPYLKFNGSPVLQLSTNTETLTAFNSSEEVRAVSDFTAVATNIGSPTDFSTIPVYESFVFYGSYSPNFRVSPTVTVNLETGVQITQPASTDQVCPCAAVVTVLR